MAASPKLSVETPAVRHTPLAHGQSVSCRLYSSDYGPTSPLSIRLNPSIALPEMDSNYLSRKFNSNNDTESTDQAAENPRRYKFSATSMLNRPLFPESDGNDNKEQEDDLDRDNVHNYCEGSSSELHGNANITQNRALRDATNNITQNRALRDATKNITQHRTLRDATKNITQHRTLRDATKNITQHRALRDATKNITQHRALRDATKNITQHRALRDATKNITQHRALRDATKLWLPCSNQCNSSSPTCNYKAKMTHQDMYLYGNSKDHDQIKPVLISGLQHSRDSKNTTEQYENEGDNNEHVLKTFSDCESSTQNQTDCANVSSCNSSDGVLVHFSAIYSTANNAAFSVPDDLDCPAKQSGWSDSISQDDDGKPSVCWSPCGVDPNCNIYPLDSDALSLEIPTCTAVLQGQEHLMTSTQSYYKLVNMDFSIPSSPSPVCPSWNSFCEAHSRGSLTSPTEYCLFKQPEEVEILGVNQNDLQVGWDTELKRDQRATSQNQAQHPSAKGAELNDSESTGTAELHSREEVKGCQDSPNQEARLHVPSHPIKPDISLSAREPRCSSQTDTDLFSQGSKQHITSYVEFAHGRRGDRVSPLMKNSVNTKSTSPSATKVHLGPEVTATINQSAKMPNSVTSDIYSTESTFEEPCTSSTEVVRYTKAQRPTSLPIQPFILQPSSGQQYSMLSQHISHLLGKTGSSKNTGKCKQLRASPVERYHSYSVDLQSSSDTCSTCSTCSPSPVQSHNPPHWLQARTLPMNTHPESNPKTPEPKLPAKSPGQTHLDQKNPTPKQCNTGQTQSSVHHVPAVDSLQTSLPAQAPLFQIPYVLQEKLPNSRLGSPEEYGLSPHSPSPASPTKTSRTSDTSVISVSGAGPPWSLYTALWPNISFQLKDLMWMTSSFCWTERNPQTSPECLSINLLHKPDLLKTVSSAVDLITAHFSSCSHPEEKVQHETCSSKGSPSAVLGIENTSLWIRLGNSLLCPSISKMILGQFCPAIRNILQDGLRVFKRDLIVGQRRYNPWSVVDASTQPGPSTRILHSLVSVVKKCPQLTSHSMRLNAFFLGLLNLHALEEWFYHLHTCAGVLAEYYHPWAFLPLSQGPACGSLFQELLLLLQPLSHLPFHLHLLSELRLQSRPKGSQQSPTRPPPLSACLLLQISSSQRRSGSPEKHNQKEEIQLHTVDQRDTHMTKKLRGCAVKFCKLSRLLSPGEQQESVSAVSSKIKRAGWWLAEAGICSNSPSHAGGVELLVKNRESRMVGFSAMSPSNRPTSELRWARLFGSRIGTPVAVDSTQKINKPTQRSRLPSQWLKLGTSRVELVTQWVWGGQNWGGQNWGGQKDRTSAAATDPPSIC